MTVGEAHTQRMHRRDWFLVAIAVAPTISLAIVAIVGLGHGYHGANDNAMNELRITDIGSHWPLIGPFSRDGWSHPGPALFYVMLLPFRLTGSHSNGLLVGAALINGAAIAGMIVVARRHGGTALAALIALGCLILVTRLTLTFTWDPWNPFLPVFPFGLVVLATWGVTNGDAWCLPIVVGVGSFCAQTHIGYLPLVAVLTAVAAFAMLTAAHRNARRSHAPIALPRAPIYVTIGVLVLFWFPPLIQHLTTDPSNVRSIVHFFLAGKGDKHTLREAYNVVTAQFAWHAPWMFGGGEVNVYTGEPVAMVTTSWPVWWLAFGAALAWAWIKGNGAARRFGIVLVIAIVASILAISATVGPVEEYRQRFLMVLGMFSGAFAGWILWRALAQRTWFPARAATAVVFVAAVALSTYNVARAPGTEPPNVVDGRIVAALSPQLIRDLPARPGVVRLAVKGPTGPLLPGLMVDLEHHGIPVAMRDIPDDRLRFGRHRIFADQPIRSDLSIVADAELERVAARPCARLVAYWGRASRHVRARAVRAVADVARALRNRSITGPEAYRRVRRLSPALPAVAIFDTRCRRGERAAR